MNAYDYFLESLFQPPDQRDFSAGKSVDMPYLAALEQVQTVVGIEGVPMAVEQFLKENPESELKQSASPSSAFKVYKGMLVHIG